jgi:hypothetical protein
MVAAKKPGTSIVSFEDRMAKYAKQTVETEKPSASAFVSVRAGQLQYGGQPVAGNKLDVVIAGFGFENAYYVDDFDSDNPKSPVCFSFASEDEGEDDMVPHPDSMEPQSDACKGCQWNEFGSAEKGKGKACKNIRRLALLSAKPLTDESMLKGEMAVLKTPVTSVKGWKQYANTIATVHGRPPFAVVTQLGCVPDPKSQFKLTFEHMLNIADEEVVNAIEKRRESMDCLHIPYQPNEEKPAKPARGKPAAKGKASKY